MLFSGIGFMIFEKNNLQNTILYKMRLQAMTIAALIFTHL